MHVHDVQEQDPTFWGRVTSSIGFRADTSLIGGNCSFSVCNQSSFFELAKNLQSGSFDRIPAFFFVGQGSTFIDFEQANSYCNNTMKLAVDWLVGKDGEAPAIPAARRAQCYLGHGVIPLYIYYSDGKNISEERTKEIAKSLSDSARS